jgi:hypothetical protein
MKLYDIKVATKDRENKTHWHTIGTVFTSDDTILKGTNDKPAGFVINWPEAQGIIVAREKKKEKPQESPDET